MYFVGIISGRVYTVGALLAQAGEASVYLVEGEPKLLLKVFEDEPTALMVRKLGILAAWPTPPAFTALPLESVCNPTTNSVVGFVQPFFRGAIPYSRVIDDHGRSENSLPGHLHFRVRQCRMLAEAFLRLHVANLSMGDVSDTNFLLGRDFLGRAHTIYVIDTNAFHFQVRTHAGNEVYVAGGGTEAYVAPEVQGTDWSKSHRSVFTDSFGFAVLAWRTLFNGSHPFAVSSPPSADIPPLGRRIQERLFPYQPAKPLPPGWKAANLSPSLSILPVPIREMLFRAFAADDPRDRPLAADWLIAFRAWESDAKPTLLGAVLSKVGGNRCEAVSLGDMGRRIAIPAAMLAMILISRNLGNDPVDQPTPKHEFVRQGELHPIRSDAVPLSSPPRSSRIDRDLFPATLLNPELKPRK